jgi:hypothetical protein
MSMRELRASVILKVHYLFVAIILGASGANDEIKFDDFTAEYGQMLKLAESILGASTPNYELAQKSIYVFNHEPHSNALHGRSSPPGSAAAEKTT